MAKRRNLLSAIGGGIVTAGVLSGTGTIEINEDVEKKKVVKELEEDTDAPSISTVSGSPNGSSIEFSQGFTEKENDLLVYFLIKNTGRSPLRDSTTLNYFSNGSKAVVQEQISYSIPPGETRIFTFGDDKSNDEIREIQSLQIV